jgi:hypothetical protein
MWEWVDDPVFAELAEWTNEVELADVDADGDLDVILANGGGYSTPEDPEPTWWLQNDGAGNFVAVELVVGLHRTAKVRDFDGDSVPDVFLPGAWGTPSVLLRGDGAGGLQDASAGLPTLAIAIGDAEPGDVDGDGDLDLVLSDSGEQNALFSQGEPTRLWLNDGAGTFTDVTDAQMPALAVRWSWDLELFDIDLDQDLDLLVSCKTCASSSVFTNDGAGTFTDISALALPEPRSNNYDFEALDLTGDGLPDLVTINDGPGLDERLLVNDGTSAFRDETAERLPGAENMGEDDNVAVFLDAEHDGDIDIVIGSLSGDDRLLVNDGTGHFTTDTDAIIGPDTPGTLALAAGDLDGDHKIDLVMGQGEVAEPDGWYRGVDLPEDTLGPEVSAPTGLPLGPVRATAHDRKTPVLPDDLAVTIEWTVGDATGSIPLHHVGGTLWWGSPGELPSGEGTAQTCATDRAGNTLCSEALAFGTEEPDDTGVPDTGEPPPPEEQDPGEPYPQEPDEKEGCGCANGGAAPAFWPWLLALAAVRRRARGPGAG